MRVTGTLPDHGVAAASSGRATTFDYLLEKIERAPFADEPFRHLEILDVLAPEHFAAIVGHPQIALDGAASTEELLDGLARHGYEIIPFPGCVTSADEYLRWFHGGSSKRVHAATEGFGIVLRLNRYDHPLLAELNAFFESEDLTAVLRRKFGIERPVTVDAGIQKYLHGYEISPHPDIRRKALTWMLNINPGAAAEEADFHTHYLRLKPQWRYVSEFWRHNPEVEREWVPWDWCETVKRQTRNNSIVFFAPGDDTVHAVKADYDHLSTQRTQFYGNLWYERAPLKKLPFQQLDLAGRAAAPSGSGSGAVGGLRSGPVGAAVRRVRRTLRRDEAPRSIRKI